MKQEEDAQIVVRGRVQAPVADRLIDDEAAAFPLSSDPLFVLASDERLCFNFQPSSPDVPEPAEQVIGDGDIEDTSDVPVLSLRPRDHVTLPGNGQYTRLYTVHAPPFPIFPSSIPFFPVTLAARSYPPAARYP